MKEILVPYNNQVTGHDCLLTTKDKTSVCKVRHQKEMDFYQNMDQSLAHFTPKFQGVIDVTVTDDGKGYCRFETLWNDTILDKHSLHRDYIPDRDVNDKKIAYRSADPVQLERENGFRSNDYTRDQKFEESKILQDTGQNPWVDRVHRIGRHVKYIGRTIPYIVLENISASFERPCILDLKMGTQIHDLDCPREKQRKHVAKNKLTTTCTMGLRLCGLQVYECGSYHCRDKYYGRGLSEDGLHENIKLFFSCAKENRPEVLSIISNKIYKLRKAVSVLHGYRFNGTSLILMYEGCGNTTADANIAYRADARVVDFAHSSICTPRDQEGPDSGFILGLDNLLKSIERFRS